MKQAVYPEIRDGFPGKWRGLDCRAFQSFDDGVLRVAENVVVRPSGELGVRPGFRGQLSGLLGGAIETAIEFVYTGGKALLLSVSVGSGEIWRWEVGATTATKISGAVAFTTSAVNFARLGSWVFISGAADGKLYRYDGTTFEAAMGLTQPVYTLTPGVTNRGALLSPTDLTRWKSRWSSSPGNKISETESLFPGGSTIRTDSTGATPGNLMQGLNAPTGVACIELQPNVSGATESTVFDAIELPTTVAGFLNTGGAADGLRSEFVRLGYFVAAEDTLSLYPGGFGELLAFSDVAGTTALSAAGQRLYHPELSRDAPLDVSLLFDGRGDGAASLKARWEYTGLDTAKGIDVTRASFTVFGQKFIVENVGGWAQVRQGSYPAENGRVLLTGAYLEYEMVASAAWSPGRAFMSLSLPAGIDTSLVQVSVINSGGTAAIVGTLALSQDKTIYELDFSAVPAAVLATALKVRLTWLSDVAVQGASDSANSVLLNVGALTDSGPLSVGYNPYKWLVQESAGGITSPASLASVEVVPTSDNATGQVVLGVGPPQNAAATLTFFRLGGVLTSWRKVASVSAAASTSGSGWSWNHTTRTFLDFTLDQTLAVADELDDHAGTPLNARAIATFARRLAILTDTQLWLSRAVSGAAAGLYYDTANDPDSPAFAAQGVVFSSADAAGITSAPGDALRLFAWDNRLIAFFSSTVLRFDGSSPANFSLLSMESGSGGLLSRRAVCVHAGRLVWLSGVGLLSLAARGSEERTGELERLGEEVAAMTGIGGEHDADAGMLTALAASSLWSADGRLFWGLSDYLYQAVNPATAPVLAGAPAVLVLAGGGWFCWRGFPAAVRGGLALSARRGSVALGATGQVYRLADEFGDKALSASSVAAVAVLCSSAWRGLASRVHRIFSFGFSGRAAAQTTLTVEAWTLGGLSAVGTWKIPAGGAVVSPRRVRFGRVVRGSRISWSAAASTTDDIALGDIEVHESEGGLFDRA